MVTQCSCVHRPVGAQEEFGSARETDFGRGMGVKFYDYSDYQKKDRAPGADNYTTCMTIAQPVTVPQREFIGAARPQHA